MGTHTRIKISRPIPTPTPIPMAISQEGVCIVLDVVSLPTSSDTEGVDFMIVAVSDAAAKWSTLVSASIASLVAEAVASVVGGSVVAV